MRPPTRWETFVAWLRYLRCRVFGHRSCWDPYPIEWRCQRCDYLVRYDLPEPTVDA